MVFIYQQFKIITNAFNVLNQDVFHANLITQIKYRFVLYVMKEMVKYSLQTNASIRLKIAGKTNMKLFKRL